MAAARHTITIKTPAYMRLKSYCDATNTTLGGMVEALIASRLDQLGWPEPEPEAPRPAPVAPRDPATVFTF